MRKQSSNQNAMDVNTEPSKICSFDYEAIEKPTRALMHQASRFWYFKKGHGKIFIDDAEYELKPDTLAAITPWKISNITEVDEPLQLIVIIYDYQYINSALQGPSVIEKDCNDLLENMEISPVCYLDSVQAKKMDDLMGELKQEIGTQPSSVSSLRKPMGSLYVTNKLVEIMLLYSRYVMANSGIRADATPGQKSIMSYIYAHSSEKLTLSKLADVFYASESAISREIKAMTGVGFNQLLTSIRMEKATDYLMYTNMNLEDIAHAIGLVDAPHLSKHFSNHIGMTPKKYRETYAKVKKRFALTTKESAYEIVDYLHKNYGDDTLNAQDTARQYGVTVAEMNRSLLYYCEKNFDAQLNMIRTSKACELLTDTKESVMAVAMEVGYRNIKTFNTNFTKLVGMTPSEFRQRVTFQKGYDRE